MKGKNKMEKILLIHKVSRIADVCKVTERTVYNWINRDNMPFWAVRKLGYEIIKKGS